MSHKKALALLLCMAWYHLANSQETSTVVGKDGWYFFRYERFEPKHKPDINTTLNLLEKANRLFKENDITVLFTITPLKIRLYPEFLPKEFQPHPAMLNNHSEALDKLRQSGAFVADQETAFKTSISENQEKLLFLRQDSHWTPAGAMLAAKTLRTTISQNPLLKNLLNSTPSTSFELTPGARPMYWRSRDLIPDLPKGSPPPAPEMISTFDVKPKNSTLMEDKAPPSITLIGSSFVAKITQFANATRYTLQHDLLDISIPGTQGPWVGMESYLNNAAFIANRPKLLIWEIPERDLANPPASPWRKAIYQRNEHEWLLATATQLSSSCLPAATKVSTQAKQFADAASAQDITLQKVRSSKASYFEFTFDKPLKPDEYLLAEMSTTEGGALRFELDTSSGKRTQWASQLPDDGKTYPVKANIPLSAGEVRQLRLYPGESAAVSLSAPRICQLNKPWLLN